MSTIQGALVQVFKNGVLIAEGYTDVNGKYSVQVSGGYYHIKISKSGYKTIDKYENIIKPSEIIVNLPKGVAVMGEFTCVGIVLSQISGSEQCLISQGYVYSENLSRSETMIKTNV